MHQNYALKHLIFILVRDSCQVLISKIRGTNILSVMLYGTISSDIIILTKMDYLRQAGNWPSQSPFRQTRFPAERGSNTKPFRQL